VILTGKSEAISQAARTLHGSELTPTQADLLSNKLLTNLDLGTGIGLIARFQSISESVQEQSKRLLLIGEKLGLQGVIYSGNQEIDLWQQLPKQIYDHLTESTITCKIGVLPTAAVEILNYMEVGLIHISSGLGLVRLEKEEQILPLRSLCQANSGFLSVLSAPVEFKKRFDVWGYNGNALAVMRGIKEQFDGNFILSPGRFVGGI
jgi:glycolate oxidase FAD binding subunit